MTEYFSQLAEQISLYLPTENKASKDAFEALPITERLWRFLNWNSRLVHPHCRQIHLAARFYEDPRVRHNIILVERLLAKLASGQNVSGHLSNAISCGYSIPKTQTKGGRDFDLLLNDCGITHLHLDQKVNGKFDAKCDSLLFAIFGRGVAFVLGVGSHSSWGNTDFVEIAQRSWPNQQLFFPLGISSRESCSPDDYVAFRKAGLSSPKYIDNQALISGVTLGLTMAQVSARTMFDAAEVLRKIASAERDNFELIDQMKSHANLVGRKWPMSPRVTLQYVSALDRFGFAFVEEETGVVGLI